MTPVAPAPDSDDGRPDVLVGHDMLSRQDLNISRTTTSWQQQPQSTQQQLAHHHQQQPPHLQPLQQQYHQVQLQPQSFTPLGLGAHGADWRNDGASGSADQSGLPPYQDAAWGYASAFSDAETSNRYGSQHCSGLPEPENHQRYYNQQQSTLRDSDLHYGQHHMTSEDPECNRFSQNFQGPGDTDGRYLAIPVNDTGAQYTQQPALPSEDDNRNSYNHSNSYHVDNGVTVRYRSMSSEPRAGRKDADNRRVRCSSANRVRQTRSRNGHINSSSTSSGITPQTMVASSVTAQSVPLQTSSLPITTTAGAVSIVQAQQQATAPLTDRQNWDPGPSQASALPHDAGTEDRAYGVLSPPVSSSTGSYGYQVEDLEALLSHSSASQPANLPMVLASPTRLHHMRRTQANAGPSRPFLPLGVIVNAVFKTRDWLYVRTAHGAEGFVPYHVCLPLGILPTKPAAPANESTAPVAAWELQEAPLPRGRCRERRRQGSTTVNQNQTDLQKLHPMTRVTSSFPRETLLQSPQQQPLHHRAQQQPHHSSHQVSGPRT